MSNKTRNANRPIAKHNSHDEATTLTGEHDHHGIEGIGVWEGSEYNIIDQQEVGLPHFDVGG